jgi:serine/threonine-protein kinase
MLEGPPKQLGPYQLERVLGRGGMGTVYVGVDPTTQQRAAIKVLSPVLAAEENFRERFKAEIESLRTLRHRHIVQLYGFGEEQGTLFYSMQLVEGSNLQQELGAGRRFDWREVTRLGIDICRALKHAHDHGIIHRDLKPANLLLDENEQVMLTDFGIAKLFGFNQLTADGGVVGTADYMSPEQAEGLAASPRCDLYSLGSVLYALLAGRPPFTGKSLPEVIHKLRVDDPIPVGRLSPDVPEELERVIAQLLEKDPRKRIPTALAVSHRLKAMEHALTLRVTREAVDTPAPATRQDHPGDFLPAPGQSLPTDVYLDPAIARRETVALPEAKEDAGPALLAGAPSQTLISEDSHAPSQHAGGDRHDRAAGQGHFTTVRPGEGWRRLERDPWQEEKWPLAWKLAATAAMAAVVISLGWLSLRPPSADRLYQRVVTRADEGAPQQLLAVETDIREFLDRFPDDRRSEEMASFLEEIDQYRLQRRVERQSRLHGTSAAKTPVERLYAEALQLKAAQPEAAASLLEALIDVFGNQPEASQEERRILDLARDQLDSLQKSIRESSARHLEVIEQGLARAAALRAEDLAAAQAIWRGLIRLYGDKPWAAPLLEQARTGLAETAASEPPRTADVPSAEPSP